MQTPSSTSSISFLRALTTSWAEAKRKLRNLSFTSGKKKKSFGARSGHTMRDALFVFLGVQILSMLWYPKILLFGCFCQTFSRIWGKQNAVYHYSCDTAERCPVNQKIWWLSSCFGLLDKQFLMELPHYQCLLFFEIIAVHPFSIANDVTDQMKRSTIKTIQCKSAPSHTFSFNWSQFVENPSIREWVICIHH